MRLIFPLLTLLTIFLSGCSSSSSDNGTAPTSTFTWAGGIYVGTFTEAGAAPDDVVLIISSDNRFALATTNGLEYAIGTVSSSNLTTSDGFVATLTAALSGTYTAPGVTGTFALADSGLYNRASSTSKLQGIWVDNTFTQVTGTATFIIDAAGMFDMTSVSGCSGIGSFSTIDPTKNEYNFTMNVTNCAGYNGTYNGLAVTDDTTFTDDTLDIIAENIPAQTFMVSESIKQ